MSERNTKNHKLIILFIIIFALLFVLPVTALQEFNEVKIFKDITYT